MTPNPLMPARPATPPTTNQPAVPASSPALALMQQNGLPANWWLYEEAWTMLERLCGRLAGASMVPADFRGNPGNVFVALMAGLPLGLSPLASLQSVAVVNGRPTLWGDAPIAQVLAHPSLVRIDEQATGTIAGGDRTWHYQVTRKMASGEPLVVRRSYGIEDAKLAKLWGRTGREGQPTPWVTNPDRMLYNRARAFALRDAFADVLRGVQLAADTDDDGAERVKPAAFTVAGEAAPAEPAVTVTNGFGDEPEPAPAPAAPKPTRTRKGKDDQPAASSTPAPANEPAAASSTPEASSTPAPEKPGRVANAMPAGSVTLGGPAPFPVEATVAREHPARPVVQGVNMAHLPDFARNPGLAGRLGEVTDSEGVERTVHLATAPWGSKGPVPEGRSGDLVLRLLPGGANKPQVLMHVGGTWTPQADDPNLLGACRTALADSTMLLAQEVGLLPAQLLEAANSIEQHTGQHLATLKDATLRTMVVFRAHLATMPRAGGSRG